MLHSLSPGRSLPHVYLSPIFLSLAYYSVPVTKVSTTSTTYIPFIEMLGERAAIVALPSSVTAYVSSPCLKKRMADGQVTTVTGDTFSTGWTNRNTALTTAGVTLTIADSFSKAALNAFVMTDTKETSTTASTKLGGTTAALQSAEYIELVALFFNREAEANAAFGTIVDRYECTTKDIKAEIAKFATPMPAIKVLWASWANDGSGNSGWSIGTCPSYYCEAIITAGGELVTYTGVVGDVTMWGFYKYLSTAQLLAGAGATADVFIHSGNWSSAVEGNTLATLAAGLAAVQSGRVFDTNRMGSTDWFESRVAEPDVFLRDVASALHPSHANLGQHDRAWLRQHDEGGEERAACGIDSTVPHKLQGDPAWCGSLDSSAASQSCVGAPLAALAAVAAAGALLA